MKGELENLFELNVSQAKLKRAKGLALLKLEGSFLDDYNKLEAYGQELRQSNPGTDVVINISRGAPEEGKRKFLRMYICFNALKLGWKSGLRPLIGVDGTFLKGRYKDKDTSMTWTWLFQCLQLSLELKNGLGVTFISDMQKGLIDAVKNTFPESHHRFCVRHIEANWQKKWRNGQMKKLMWWCVWSTYEEEFKNQLRKLGELSKEDNHSATKDLLHFSPQAWCRAYLDTRCKNMMVDNNFTESFNSWVLQARSMPIIKMLEEIRIKVMNLLVKNEDEIKKWRDDFSPQAVEFNGEFGYEISEGDDRHIVDLFQKIYTCRVCQLSGIPCPHAIKAVLYDKGEAEDDVHWFYSKEAYSLTYKNKLQLVRGQKFWKITEAQAIDPPDIAKTVGRPKVNRVADEARKRKGEWSLSRRGIVMTCSNCGDVNHNTRGCFKKVGEKGASNIASSSTQPPQDFDDWFEEFFNHDAATEPMTQAFTEGADEGSMPKDLAYSPTKTTWGGNATLTPRQLEAQARRKRKKIGSKGKEAVVPESDV
ncbi:uncharacterized protein LOC132618265 [Lycium barbarum]|uniref:uncharacterized protein LOC132618265 n=1 Tax=Lycium barbarum TaxID=112863 RepID=UPI00293F1ACF|nr:uncharacterized protein LOC132618265 [Lycium barbarum]